MEQKPGWTYRYIDSLGMYIAVNDNTGVMYTEDKIMYTVEEEKLLKKIDYKMPLSVHIIKKAFGGLLISL